MPQAAAPGKGAASRPHWQSGSAPSRRPATMLIVCLKGIAWPQGTPDSRNRFGVSCHPIMNPNTLPLRPQRRRMAAPGTPAAVAAAQTRQATHQIPPPGNRQRHPLHPPHRRRLAYAAPRPAPCRIVFHYYSAWQQDGVWRQVNDALCQQTRQRQGRPPEPGAAIMDRQSVKTTEKGGPVATMPSRK